VINGLKKKTETGNARVTEY